MAMDVGSCLSAGYYSVCFYNFSAWVSKVAFFEGEKHSYCSINYVWELYYSEWSLYSEPSYNFFFPNVQNKRDEAIAVLSKIYNYERLEDEVEYLTALSEKERNKRKDIKYSDVFKLKEIRHAFFVGAGLQVIWMLQLKFLVWSN